MVPPVEYLDLLEGLSEEPTLRNLLAHWNNVTNYAPESRFTVDLSRVDSDEVQSAIGQVILASGHYLAGTVRDEPLVDASQTVTDFVISETIFIDTETDRTKRKVYLEKYSVCLRSISQLKLPRGAVHIHITYCSVDKAEEIVALAEMVLNYNRYHDGGSRFLLATYAHPTNGYPPVDSGRPAARRLPTKHAPYNLRVAEKPLGLFTRYRYLLAAERFYRLAIDDDDLWSRFAIGEIVRIGTEAASIEGRSVRAIGLANQVLYYADSKRADIAELRPAMNGSKFFMSAEWGKIRVHSPFQLPEYFSAQIERRHRRMGVDLRIVRNNRPIFIYVRGHASISKASKTSLYRKLLASEDATTFSQVLDLVEDYCFHHVLERPVLAIDPPTLEARGSLVENQQVLEVHTNIEELVRTGQFGNGSPEDHILLLRIGRDGVRQDLEFDLNQPISIDTSGLDARMTLALRDAKDQTVHSAWVRGAASFLS